MAHARCAQAGLAQVLHAQACQVLALALGLVSGLVRTSVGLAVVAATQACFVAAPQVHILVRMAGLARGRSVGAQGSARAGVVVFARGIAAAGEAVGGAETVDVFAVNLVAQRVEGDGVVSANALVFILLRHLKGAVVVAPDQAVHAAGMFEVVVNAPLLHQAGDELKVGLVVLHLVVALGVGFDQAFVSSKSVVRQDEFNHFNRRHVLKHFAVCAQGGNVQPRAQGDFIQSVAGLFADKARSGDQPGDLAHARALVSRTTATWQADCEGTLAFQFHVAGQLQADEGIQIEVAAGAAHEVEGVRRLQGQLVLKQAVDALGAFKPQGNQRGLTCQHGNGGAFNGECAWGAEQARHIQTPCIALHRRGAKQQKTKRDWGVRVTLRCVYSCG